MQRDYIEAEVKNLKEFFGESTDYTIPDFQRPYQWEGKDGQVMDLLEDLKRAYDEDQKHFIGPIVMYVDSKDKSSERIERFVIDGQQRLVTLALLAKVLLIYNKTVELQEIIHPRKKIVEENTSSVYSDKIRIKSLVLSGDEGKKEQDKIEDVLIGGRSIEGSKVLENYEFIDKELKKFFREEEVDSADFIEYVLYKVTVLSVVCNEEESAIEIFQTLNDRGMPLDETNIFKARMYQFAGKEGRADFNKKWYALEDDTKKSPEGRRLYFLFQCYMHVCRGKEGESSTTRIALRKFFGGKDKDGIHRLQNWQSVMESLRKLYYGVQYLEGDNEYCKCKDIKILNLYIIMLSYPNKDLWPLPIMVFLNENIQIDAQKNPYLEKDKETEFKNLLKINVRYCLLEPMLGGDARNVKSVIFKVIKSIMQKEDYTSHYENRINEIAGEARSKERTEKIERLRDILTNNETNKLHKPLLYLHASTHKDQEEQLPVGKDGEIEHILPKKWQDFHESKELFTGWKEEFANKYMNSFGNTVLLEMKLNKQARQNALKNKKAVYETSNVMRARDVADKNDKWLPEDVKKRNEQVVEDLMAFLLLEQN